MGRLSERWHGQNRGEYWDNGVGGVWIKKPVVYTQIDGGVGKRIMIVIEIGKPN